MAKILSPRFHIDTIGWKKVGKGALIAGSGAILTFLEGSIPGIEFGNVTIGPITMNVTPWVVMGNSVLVQFLRKFIGKY